MTVRVAYVITDSGFGGSESVLYKILAHLDRSRILPVGVIVLKNKREMAAAWEKLGIPVVSLGMGWLPSPLAPLKLRQILSTWSPDVVHAFLYHSAQLSRLAKKIGAPGRLLTSPRVNYRFIPGWARRVDRVLKSIDDGILSESRASARYLQENLGYDSQKITVVSNGVEPKKFVASDEDRKRVRHEWGVSDNEILIGGVGRLHEQKGFDLLLESLPALTASKTPYRLVLVGEGPELENLKIRAKRCGQNPIFAGKKSDMSAVYAALDIFVQSSRYEGMSNALLEAMAAGKPCVATAVDGTLDLARDGENMVLVKPENKESLSLGIGLLLEKKDLREKLAKGARETAQVFSLNSMVRKFEDVYESLAR